MTRPKKADRPLCNVSLVPAAEGGMMFTQIEWIDTGKERVSARITKALRWQGHEARTGAISPGTSFHENFHPGAQHRHCIVMTAAPLEVVEKILARYFLEVRVDRTVLPEPEATGTAADLIDMDL